jgi:F-type H+-transporting ATPase subunit delta|uniref:ATP synthase CF1 delta subunit n=1 Tax=Thorea hispida TaxID=202687 RepID=A0A1C9CAF1_9FLOR|nr:ATP synthase CF1 delta subunit [Thorea hispida]AOM65339.1 ATP synthase CF1 delta subunit [Thorea hispida]ARX95899.1 ATP synthase delta chain [Thorea hispida]UNJ79184.1 ATP synthase CF1 delta subunit [Thorea hispida]
MSNKNFVRTISLPYAEALIDLTNSLQDKSKFSKDLEDIYLVVSKSKDLRLFLSNPLINKPSKKIVISNLFAKQINPIIINFLFVILDKKRISFLKEILELYFQLYFSTQSSKLAHVYTVQKFTLEQQEALIEKLQTLTKSQKVQLDIIIDPSLVAGLIIKIDSQIIDVSLHGQLQSMATFLHSN